MNETTKRGVPKMWGSAFDLGIAVDMYFMECDERDEPYTVEGLADALDMDRRTLLNYAKEESHAEFNAIVLRAKRKILRNVVVRGSTGKSDRVVTIFNLKNNFGYVDKTEHEVNNKIDIQQITGAKITPE